jgi:hypothetical protein
VVLRVILELIIMILDVILDLNLDLNLDVIPVKTMLISDTAIRRGCASLT